ncbi:putative aflatoxin efflux pump [Aaosphaeria arxii CBS 175.79]|uniref:Putative aflatoxin efflux pump n=1 Tax=Aaosphaeria arxii CBS 175.79 TaxID=1450172 RepID=A0A6A5XNN5_9PLEO|nr:putative aflatoxin efflux pump [Aaosphaeria arxii CBS 175.79]KAF2014457.1 putative aflatoxin efflux pump [Aaosphaeria arxii CBS 175.79]
MAVEEKSPPVRASQEGSRPPSLAKEAIVQAAKPEEHQYPSMAKTWIIMISLYIAMFLIALDKTILATAVPRITDEFHSLKDISWYVSAYMLTLCAFQLIWGRIYTLFPVKMVFIGTILVFEVGSVVCGAASSSTVFIVGRAIAGLGGAGMMNGAIVVLMSAVPLEKRPIFQGLIGAVFGIASVVGPLLGGVFTEKVTWRWCFYINLPCGAVAIAILIFFLHLPPKPNPTTPAAPKTLIENIKQFDPIGSILFLPSIICLLLALQWGGTKYNWSNWRIILLLTLFAILFILFLVVQILNPQHATIPTRILVNRTIACAFFFTFISMASMQVMVYYIPIFFQALKGFSPISSGLATLAIILPLVIGTILAGGLVQRLGYPAPFMIISCIIWTTGAGLVTTWPIDVKSSMWIGYQFLIGFGIGLGMQQPNLIAQIVLKDRRDATMGVSLMMFGQNLGGAVFIAVAQSVFTDSLAGKLSAIPGLNLTRQDVVSMGATHIRDVVPKDLLPTVLIAYRAAIRNAFYVGVSLAAISILGALGVEWVSVKKPKSDAEPAAKEGGKEERKLGEEEKETV